MSSGRSRGWCFTLNNYNDDDLARLGDVECVYYIHGRERGDSGTPHLQGYIHFRDAKTLSSVKRLLGERAHLEPRRGSVRQAVDYCRKEGVCDERGECPLGQGSRTDLSNIRDRIREGANMRGLAEVSNSYQALRAGQLLLTFLEQPRCSDSAPVVHWFYGLTGTGKSKAAFERWPKAYRVSHGVWWNGYDGHIEVTWDDFRPSDVPFHRLLKLLDRYPVLVECKGGMRQLRAETICITSTEHPSEMFVDADDKVDQLLRRITKITHFVELGQENDVTDGKRKLADR